MIKIVVLSNAKTKLTAKNEVAMLDSDDFNAFDFYLI